MRKGVQMDDFSFYIFKDSLHSEEFQKMQSSLERTYNYLPALLEVTSSASMLCLLHLQTLIISSGQEPE